MDQPFYPFVVLDEAHRFDFVSVGKRIITKRVAFQQIDKTEYYNLVLADVTAEGNLDAFVISNNGDIRKVLSTVFQCIVMFLNYNPKAVIIFYGSTPERTAIYQRAIKLELNEASLRFRIQGYNGVDFEDFNAQNEYSAFAISLKNK